MVMVGAIAFSSKAVLVKLAYLEGIDALNLLTLRMLFALPFYLLIAYFANRQATYRLTKKDFLLVAVMGILGYYLASLFDFLGLEVYYGKYGADDSFCIPFHHANIWRFIFQNTYFKITVCGSHFNLLRYCCNFYGRYKY